MTNAFKPQDLQYRASHAVRLPTPTADTARLLTAARNAVHRLWRDGYRYKKAGVELVDLVAMAGVQADLWETPDSGRRLSLMRAIDQLNAEHGRGTLQFAASGVTKGWKLRCEQKSAHYTTDWAELLVV